MKIVLLTAMLLVTIFTDTTTATTLAYDCMDHYNRGSRISGVYMIMGTDFHKNEMHPVFCSMQRLGGWTVLQRRRSQSFKRHKYNIARYIKGFGYVRGDHWIGLGTIHELTKSANAILGIDLWDFNREFRWMEYDDFQVTAGPDYRIFFNKTSYRGNAGDGGKGLSYHHGLRFTTPEMLNRDVPKLRLHISLCAALMGGGFWFNTNNLEDCATVYTTGTPGRGSGLGHTSTPILWTPWKTTGLQEARLRVIRPHSCDNIYRWLPHKRVSGIHDIIVAGENVQVFCQMENTGGWIVIQKRTGRSVSFDRHIADYKQGFGDKNGDHWLGLDTVSKLTEFGNWKGGWIVRFDFESFDNETAYAEYTGFQVTAGPDYKLLFDVDSYRGTAGDGGENGLRYNHGLNFCARDTCICAFAKQGGFWYINKINTACSHVYPTATDYYDVGKPTITWEPWKGDTHLKSVTIRIMRVVL